MKKIITMCAFTLAGFLPLQAQDAGGTAKERAADRVEVCKQNYHTSMEHMHCLFQYAFL